MKYSLDQTPQEILRVLKSNTTTKDALLKYLDHYIVQRENNLLETKDDKDLFESRGVVKFLRAFKKELLVG